ncbi:gamma-glutamyltransferase family protein [Congregibacter brevis]|uniref:Gamma-glutamyltransferase family protein n=1 Tax=Congregibacter brevis TaxID=3081201 RepID=A0ABZ0ICL0_9GAMM|nr:gamma-glutamyltransferase family protein [Congregibacter sp. IMCC45268]
MPLSTKSLRNPALAPLLLSPILITLYGCTPGPKVDEVANTAEKTMVTFGDAMVVTANPIATSVGEEILRAGGSAVDAAVAIESILSLVEPQSSGLGGGGFMVYYHAADQSIEVYDGREKAPLGAHSDMFLQEDGTRYGYLEAKNSGLSIGVPGMVSMLDLAHSDRGRLPWGDLLEPAKRLATEGFIPSPRLRSFFEKYGMRLIPTTLEQGPLDAYQYFFDDNGTMKDRIVNIEYADTLDIIAKDPKAFYRGPLAEAMVSAAAHSPRAGTLSLDDLASYSARKLEPLCMDYRELTLCGPPPPSSWVAVGMTLGMLEATNFPTGDEMTDWAMFTEAQRLAYADRDFYVADDDAVAVPLSGMLNRDYLAQRAALISPDGAAEKVLEGDPWAFDVERTAALPGRDTTIDYAGTTHFVVVDKWGNAVSMTATVESIFGSTRMAGGMFLNNELTDFAKEPRDADGVLVANHPAPGKRPRSSMSPTIALNSDGSFNMATGSPGGNSIIAYTLKTLVGVIDWELTPQEAVNLPNVVARGDTVRVESARASAEMLESMRAFGFQIKESAGENSGLSVILRHDDGSLEGGVDPRREGTIATITPEP